jgi:hypothetical protein
MHLVDFCIVQLRHAVGVYAHVRHLQILRDPVTALSTGVAFVELESKADAVHVCRVANAHFHQQQQYGYEQVGPNAHMLLQSSF